MPNFLVLHVILGVTRSGWWCRPPQTSAASEQSVNSVHLNPQNVDQVIVCTRSPSVFIMTLQGQVRCLRARK